MVMARIARFNKRSPSAAFFYFLSLLSWCIPSFADCPCLKSERPRHDQCGTLEERNYCAAFYALREAIELFRLRHWATGSYKPLFFPKANHDILDSVGHPLFYYEGSLFWEAEAPINVWNAKESSWQTPADDFLCRRVMQKAVQIDVPICIFQEEDESLIYPPEPIFIEEERVFKLYKDYSALLSVFYVLQQDLAFICENNKAFLRRRMQYPEYYYKMSNEDFKKRIQYYEEMYQWRSQQIEEYQEKAVTYCKKSLDYCIAHHNNRLARVNRGLFDYLDGNVADALDQIDTALKKANVEDLKALKDNALLLKGRSELEAGLYADAILTLTELIDENPNNKGAYFERAGAYFELGNFDLSLEDYLTSETKSEPVSTKAMVVFSLGLAKGVVQGGTQAGIEFIPSLLSSLQGIGHGLWAFAQDPVQMSIAFVQASQECINFIREHTPQETLTELAPELKELIENWGQLGNERKGEITGHIIGKYGVDIFAGVGLTKVMKSYRELKRANNLLTFEAMAISERNKSLIKLEAGRRAQARKEILQRGNLKIQPDKQGKHLIDHKNYIPSDKKSILEHPNPQKLFDEFAGKGIKATDLPPGAPGYQEIVNFGEFIGYAIDRDTGEKIATSWGKIHYAKDGVHIVPRKPR
jgi:tetratricopeptide (TPR) repeat protein